MHTGPVVRLPSGTATVDLVNREYVRKVFPPPWTLSACRRSVNQARALRLRGVRFVAPIDRLGGRAWGMYGGSPATTWRFLEGGGPVDWPALGDLVRRLHLVETSSIASSAPRPDGRLRHIEIRLRSAEFGQCATETEVAEIRRWLRQLEFEFQHEIPPVVVHGDMKTANIVWRPSGPVMVDLDSVTVDQPEVDLGWLLAFASAGNIDDSAMQALVEAYGLPWSTERALAYFRAAQLSTLTWNILRRSRHSSDAMQANDRLDWFSLGALIDGVPPSVFT